MARWLVGSWSEASWGRRLLPTVASEEPQQQVDENRQAERERERPQETAGRATKLEAATPERSRVAKRGTPRCHATSATRDAQSSTSDALSGWPAPVWRARTGAEPREQVAGRAFGVGSGGAHPSLPPPHGPGRGEPSGRSTAQATGDRGSRGSRSSREQRRSRFLGGRFPVRALSLRRSTRVAHDGRRRAVVPLRPGNGRVGRDERRDRRLRRRTPSPRRRLWADRPARAHGVLACSRVRPPRWGRSATCMGGLGGMRRKRRVRGGGTGRALDVRGRRRAWRSLKQEVRADGRV